MLLKMFLNPFWGTPLPRFPSQPSLSKRNTAQSKRAFLGLHRRRLSYWNSDCSGRFDMEQDITCFPRRPVPDCSRRLRVLLFKSSRFLVIIGSNSWNHVVSPQSLSSVTAVTIFQRASTGVESQSWKTLASSQAKCHWALASQWQDVRHVFWVSEQQKQQEGGTQNAGCKANSYDKHVHCQTIQFFTIFGSVYCFETSAQVH